MTWPGRRVPVICAAHLMQDFYDDWPEISEILLALHRLTQDDKLAFWTFVQSKDVPRKASYQAFELAYKVRQLSQTGQAAVGLMWQCKADYIEGFFRMMMQGDYSSPEPTRKADEIETESEDVEELDKTPRKKMRVVLRRNSEK